MKVSCFGWARRLYALLVAFFAFTLVTPAATTYSWTGKAGNGKWDDKNNWGGSAYPNNKTTHYAKFPSTVAEGTVVTVKDVSVAANLVIFANTSAMTLALDNGSVSAYGGENSHFRIGDTGPVTIDIKGASSRFLCDCTKWGEDVRIGNDSNDAVAPALLKFTLPENGEWTTTANAPVQHISGDGPFRFYKTAALAVDASNVLAIPDRDQSVTNYLVTAKQGLRVSDTTIAAKADIAVPNGCSGEIFCAGWETSVRFVLTCNHDHEMGEWVVVTPPTMYKEGLKRRVCTICGGRPETAPIPVLENDLVLSVSEIAIGADGVATVSYNLEAIGEKEVSIVAEYQKAGDTVWTKVELAKATEIGAGQGTITGLTDGISYNFKVYADGGDHTSVPVVKNDVAVPFSWTHWTGASETDNNWSTAANWENAIVVHPAQGLEFRDATTSEIVLDRDAALSCLYLGGTARLSLSGGHKLTVKETANQGKNLLYGAAELTVGGEGTELAVQPMNYMGQSADAKLMVKDGARLTNTKWRFGDNNNYTFVATNGASIALTSVVKSWANAKTQFFFAAFDDSNFVIDMNSDCFAYLGGGTFVADDATASFAPLCVEAGNPTALSDNKGALVLGLFTPNVDGASVTVRNGSTFEVRGNFNLASGGKTATLEVSGAGSKISTMAGNTVFGNGTADKLTVRLAPGADWAGETPRISIKNNATLAKNVKFVVDLAGVTPEMVGKRMPILSCTGTASYAVPGKADIVSVNNQNYVVTFSQDGKVLYMTVDYGPGLMLLLK